jgi:hypothetical protein
MILTGSDALKFLLHIKHYENIPSYPIPTPKLHKALELLRKLGTKKEGE